MHTIIAPLAGAALALVAGCGTLSAYNVASRPPPAPRPTLIEPDPTIATDAGATDTDTDTGTVGTIPAEAPIGLTAPTIGGDPTVGSTLTASPGSWSGTAPVTTSFQWQRCAPDGTGCADLVGATSATYVASREDILHTVLVRVVATNEAGAAEARSAPVGITFRPGTACDDSGGSVAAPERLEHVIVFLMAWQDAEEVHAGTAPYVDDLVGRCGSSSAYLDNVFASDLPAAPHVLALTSGSNCDVGLELEGEDCVVDDTSPGDVQLGGDSIFGQVASWRSYHEDMPSACDDGEDAWDTSYRAKRNPAAYYAALDGVCELQDLPIDALSCGDAPGASCGTPVNAFVDDLAADTLAELTLVVPGELNDTHEDGVARGDNWLRTYLQLALSSPAYLRGGTAVYVVWDEEGSFYEGPMPNLFVSPFVAPHRSAEEMNHFAVLRAIETQLGITDLLGCAGGTPPGGGSCPDGSTAELRAIFGF